MSKIFKSLPNVAYVLNLFIRKLDISVSSYTIIEDLLEHPDYPSMLSISDSLTSWNVPNQALQLDKETCIIEQLSLPFIAHLNIDGGQFILINDIDGDTLSYSNEVNRNGTISKDEFFKDWEGILLYAEKKKESGEPNYKQAIVKGLLNQTRSPFLLMVGLSAVIYTVAKNTLSLTYLLLLLTHLTGIGVSILLLIQSLDANNPFIQNLCSLVKKTDCNAILKSEAAKVTSWLNWSETGLFYFSGSFICLVINPSNMDFISWLSLCCLPYTIYSIGYQFKHKNWCILCCTVQALLWLSAGLFFMSNGSFVIENLIITSDHLTVGIVSLLMPIAIWSFLK